MESLESLGQLIDEITPLFNRYRSERDMIKSYQAIEIMWEIGDLLKQYIEARSVRPHTLFRMVYGKSEGTLNIAQRSYIPREFQGRCYRVRRIFLNKGDIRKQVGGLKGLTCFREAMPFFDNPKYRARGERFKKLLELLNSELPTSEILRRIRLLQRAEIGIQNPRTQRLGDVKRHRDSFIEFHNLVYQLMKLGDFGEVSIRIKNVPKEFVSVLARNTNALSADGYKFFPFDVPEDMEDPWKKFACIVHELIREPDAKQRRRFRRLVPTERIVRLADMLHALTSQESYRSFR